MKAKYIDSPTCRLFEIRDHDAAEHDLHEQGDDQVTDDEQVFCKSIAER